MAELNSTIKIELDGVKEFLSTTVQIERELVQIERTLKKQGFKGNERELKQSAKSYRDAMVKASNDIKRAEKQRTDSLKKGFKEVGKVAIGITLGGAIEEILGGIINKLGEVVEANKDTNESIGNLDKAFGRLKSTGASVAIGFLELASGPIVSLVNGFEYLTTAITGYNFEQARSIALLNEQNAEFNKEVEALLATTEAIDARTASLEKLNKTSNISSKLSIDASNEEIRLYRELVNLQNRFNTATGSRIALGEQVNRKSAEFDAVVKRNAADLLTITKQQLLIKKELNTLSGGESRKLDSILKSEKLITDELKRQNDIRQQGYDRVKADVDVVEMGIDSLTSLYETQTEKGLFDDAANTLDLINIGIQQAEEAYSKLKQTTAETGELEAKKLKLLKEQQGLTELNISKAQLDTARLENEQYRKRVEYLKLFQQPGARDSEPLVFKFTDEAGKDVALETLQVLLGPLTPLPEVKANVLKLPSDVRLKIKEATELISKQIQANNYIEASYTKQIIANNRLLKIKQEISDLDAEISKKEADAGASGIRAAEELADLREDQEKRRTQLDKAQEESAKATLEANLKSIEVIRELTRARGVGTILLDIEIFDLKKAAEDSKSLGDIQSQMTKVINKYGEDAVTFNEATNTLVFNREELKNSADATVQLLINTVGVRTALIERQNAELLDIQSNYTEEELKAFKERFKGEAQILTNALTEQEQLIRGLQDDMAADRRRFDQRAIRDKRQYNAEETAVIEAHTRNIIVEEGKRYEIEAELRIRAYLKELKRIAKNGGDVEVLTKSFQLQEAEIFYKHTQNLIRISEGGAVAISDNTKKSFLSKEEARNLLLVLEQAFSDVFAAYVSYQDSVAQKAIDGIQAQLDFINTAISDTTSNINSLEADLEGKRSGRREAILRGLAIEAEREEMLTEKKISLEKKLRIAEKKASEDRKAAAIGQALINGAIGITNVWANSTIPYPAQAVFGAIQTGAIAAITGLQIATIENQTFADGGLLNGPSHAEGGIPFTIGGQPGFEAEGSEYIVNKKSTQAYFPIIEAINKSNGAPLQFADGGSLGGDANFAAMSNALSGSSGSQIIALANRPLYVSVTDINNIQSRVAKVTDVTSL